MDYRHILLPYLPFRQRLLPVPPYHLPVTMGWVGGFQNQVQTEPLTFGDVGQCPGVLEPKCRNGVTYAAMLAECGLVNVVCYHVTCHTSDTLTSNRTRSPPQVNDALTPGACQALLAYTFT